VTGCRYFSRMPRHASGMTGAGSAGPAGSHRRDCRQPGAYSGRASDRRRRWERIGLIDVDEGVNPSSIHASRRSSKPTIIGTRVPVSCARDPEQLLTLVLDAVEQHARILHTRRSASHVQAAGYGYGTSDAKSPPPSASDTRSSAPTRHRQHSPPDRRNHGDGAAVVGKLDRRAASQMKHATR